MAAPVAAATFATKLALPRPVAIEAPTLAAASALVTTSKLTCHAYPASARGTSVTRARGPRRGDDVRRGDAAGGEVACLVGDGLLLPVSDRLVQLFLLGFCHSFSGITWYWAHNLINFLFSPSRRSLESCWLYVKYSANMANKRIFINAMGKRHQRFRAPLR